MTFRFLYELLAGEHDALPARRPAETLTYDRAQSTFVVGDQAARGPGWLGRGEIPGRPRPPAMPAPSVDGSIAEEMRQLTRAQDPTTPATQNKTPTR